MYRRMKQLHFDIHHYMGNLFRWLNDLLPSNIPYKHALKLCNYRFVSSILRTMPIIHKKCLKPEIMT